MERDDSNYIHMQVDCSFDGRPEGVQCDLSSVFVRGRLPAQTVLYLLDSGVWSSEFADEARMAVLCRDLEASDDGSEIIENVPIITKGKFCFEYLKTDRSFDDFNGDISVYSLYDKTADIFGNIGPDI